MQMNNDMFDPEKNPELINDHLKQALNELGLSDSQEESTEEDVNPLYYFLKNFFGLDPILQPFPMNEAMRPIGFGVITDRAHHLLLQTDYILERDDTTRTMRDVSLPITYHDALLTPGTVLPIYDVTEGIHEGENVVQFLTFVCLNEEKGQGVFVPLTKRIVTKILFFPPVDPKIIHLLSRG